jgi:hypothetical protein
MRPLLAALCAVLLTGCANLATITPDERFTAKPKKGEMRITWLAVDNPEAVCKRLLPDTMARHKFIQACAGWAGNECLIVTGTVTNHQLLGHEVRHCFEGNFHD